MRPCMGMTNVHINDTCEVLLAYALVTYNIGQTQTKYKLEWHRQSEMGLIGIGHNDILH